MPKAQDYPQKYESWVTLKNGKDVFIRPVRPTDGHLLVDLSQKMSTQSLYLRFLWRLRVLPEDLLYRFTHLDYHSEFALAAVVEEYGQETIIAVGRYSYDPDDGHTDLAVAVRDDWQSLGLGKSLLQKTVSIGKDHGIAHFRSMMDAQNEIIRKILSTLGYEVKYSLRGGFFEVDICV